MTSRAARAFTLIELLIAVAIIAILAAIAVPNLLEAQTRSKVARAKADMSSLVTALESYAVDENTYPLNAGGLGLSGALYNLTQPRAYISNLPKDIFQPASLYFYMAGGTVTSLGDEKFGRYALASAGPDLDIETTLTSTVVYDATNGTVSNGDIVMTHKSKDQEVVARNVGP